MKKRANIKAIFSRKETGKNAVISVSCHDFKSYGRPEHLFDATNGPIRDG
jgi:hypothetical protein